MLLIDCLFFIGLLIALAALIMLAFWLIEKFAGDILPVLAAPIALIAWLAQALKDGGKTK